MPRGAFNTVWASDPVQYEQPSSAIVEDGWKGGADQDPPSAGFQNWWQNRVDTMLQEIERQGGPSWLPDAVYSFGALVVVSGIRYASRTNGNVGNSPPTSAAQWQRLGTSLGYVPPGGVIMWFGSAANVPPGWAICDGTNGTQDTRNLTIVGAGGMYTVGSTGGTNVAASSSSGDHFHATTTSGAHAHAITVNNHTLTIEQIPPHVHPTGSSGAISSSGAVLAATGFGTPSMTGNQGGGQGHSHGASSASAGAHAHLTDSTGYHHHTVDVRQPYRAWYYIMRVD